ncbi:MULTISPECIES: alpha/beta hydrolase [unclassified Nodularia (in: cyanobacteria)]|uniref:alpha/beta fold hydrolase n=1 Tax=unclassified Nodularia (in: cyanobacteria) TaxID=2656917 RepID=UPI001881BA8C|nr:MULTISPECIES: alpha/beta hydrolase [unclassified Nodularia (in: cyanobacteria)]MBE9200524.1 alpha/beta hydrolase [Nodularia sp. LEGE 06071]MCC2691232.1 alpha/beta hydrolase [Nodularia sp. LEGE 04288]
MSFDAQENHTQEYKTVELPQGILHYSDRGQGPILIFLHGLLVNGRLWRDVVSLLEGEFRCIVPDLPLGSHVQPMNPDTDLTPPGLARLVADFVTALGLDDVTLVGNDTGGAICQLVINQYPEKISGLVLTNCDAFENFLPLLFRPIQYAAHIPGFIFAYAQLMRWRLARHILFGLLAHKPLESEEESAYFTPLIRFSGVRHDLTKAVRGISNRYTLEAARSFPNFKQPVLIVWGENDPFFSDHFAERLKKSFPNAQLERVAKSRAFVPEDQPELLAQLITNFAVTVAASVRG